MTGFIKMPASLAVNQPPMANMGQGREMKLRFRKKQRMQWGRSGGRQYVTLPAGKYTTDQRECAVGMGQGAVDEGK